MSIYQYTDTKQIYIWQKCQKFYHFLVTEPTTSFLHLKVYWQLVMPFTDIQSFNIWHLLFNHNSCIDLGELFTIILNVTSTAIVEIHTYTCMWTSSSLTLAMALLPVWHHAITWANDYVLFIRLKRKHHCNLTQVFLHSKCNWKLYFQHVSHCFIPAYTDGLVHYCMQ